ncbi:MAG: hypothetical protein L0241_07100 [Planctomycetia bacterium]|nr:hypothetical protein [Planctomycetia bacterium]
MFLRQLRWVAACVAAVVVACLAPAESKADIQILVQELDTGDNVVGSGSFAVGSPSGTNTFFQNFNYSTSGGHFTLTGSSATNSHLNVPNGSLSTSFTAGFTNDFNALQGHSLRITVTDDGYTGVGQPAILVNSAGAAVGFSGGTLQVDSFSRIFDPTDPSAIPASSTTALANGPTIGSQTPTATDTLPAGDPNLRITSSNVSGLPSSYAIQQVISISVTQTGTIDPNSTFTGSAGARVNSVPAPSALALALIGLPLIGLRRALRSCR